MSRPKPVDKLDRSKSKIQTDHPSSSTHLNVGHLFVPIALALLAGFGLNVLIGYNPNGSLGSPNGCNNSQQTIAKVVTPTLRRPTYWVYSQFSNVDDRNGILKHVHAVLDRLGFTACENCNDNSTNSTDWDLLWSHDYPFRSLYPRLSALKRHQLVNHFPGTGFITNKVDFATIPSKYIPRAFKLPEEADFFKQYAAEHPEALFVQKDNQHRGVVLKNATEIDLAQSANFVQEYVRKPFLVDGHKFDIGIYTVITSVNPLRVYIYKGDVLFRYCPSKYYPFDPNDLDKYVIGDDYLPTWEVPSLAPLYTAMGFGMRDAFEAYVRSKGKDPSKIWAQVEDFIGEIFRKKEHHIIAGLKNYRSGANFFEMMRFDFVIDEDLNLYALEANMSPNLSSAHFPPNQLLYEQVLYSILSLVGVAKYTQWNSLADRNAAEANMKVSDKNLAVWSDECSSESCRVTCDGVCGICRHCLSPHMRQAFAKTILEQMNRNDCKRVYPAITSQRTSMDDVSASANSTGTNLLMHIWLQGKCNQDITWCN